MSFIKEKLSGFCLIDLLIGLLISAALAFWAVPQLSSLSRQLALGREGRFFQKTVQRLLLLAEQREKTLTLSFNANGFEVYEKDQPTNTIMTHRFYAPVKTGKQIPASIEFYKSGTVSPSSLIITTGIKDCAVKISLRGRVTLTC